MVHFNSTREIERVMVIDTAPEYLGEPEIVRRELRVCPNITIEKLRLWQEKSEEITILKEAIEKGWEVKDLKDQLPHWARDYDKLKIVKNLVVKEREGISLREIL